jgi:hypothetical protein
MKPNALAFGWQACASSNARRSTRSGAPSRKNKCDISTSLALRHLKAALTVQALIPLKRDHALPIPASCRTWPNTVRLNDKFSFGICW